MIKSSESGELRSVYAGMNAFWNFIESITSTGFAFADDISTVDDANAVVNLVTTFWQYVPEKPSTQSQMDCDKIETQLPPFRQFTFQQAMLHFFNVFN